MATGKASAKQDAARRRGRPRPLRRQARGDLTRERLLRAAERLFVRYGFEAVGVERIVKAAGVTKGAFYHHFSDKLAAFRCVFEAIDREMGQKVMARAMAGSTPLEMVQLGARGCFELCTERRYGRMVYVEAPAVLGWSDWHAIDTSIASELVTAGLQAAVDAGELAPGSLPALATLVLGAILQGGIAVSTAADPQRACEELSAETDRVLLALSVYARRRH